MAEPLNDEEAALRFVVDRVAAKLEAVGRKANRIVPIATGTAPAWDDVCGGLLYSRIVSFAPATDSNIPAGAAGIRCGVHFWILTAAIAIVRCVASEDNNGNPPSAATMDAEGTIALADAVDIRNVLYCTDGIRTITLGQPLPEQGGAVGFEWTFTMRVETCSCVGV